MIEAVVQTGALEIARHFRVVAPVPTAGVDGGSGRDTTGGDRGLEGWLRGLIDGLGLERPALVAATARGAGLLPGGVIKPPLPG